MINPIRLPGLPSGVMTTSITVSMHWNGDVKRRKVAVEGRVSPDIEKNLFWAPYIFGVFCAF